MKRLATIKDHFKESQLYLNRTVAAMGIVVLSLIILIGRLAFLQLYQHDVYKTLSLNNQIRISPIIPARGLIFDRNGKIIADNIPAFSLEITPERTANLEETVEAIKSLIPLRESEILRFFKQVKYKRKGEGVPIRISLTEEEVAKISLEKYRLNGVDIVPRLIRRYPLGEPLAHALGYIGPISEKDLEHIDSHQYRGTYYIGKTGLEKYYEKDLHGISGYKHIETDSRGRTLRTLTEVAPISGQNLHLSIDSDLQIKAYEALGEFKGSIVAIDPETGEILAFVSKPSYDPNLFVQGIDKTTYQELRNSEDRPLYNRALHGTYPPGSTVKPAIALLALDFGMTTKNFGMFDPGWFQLSPGGRLYRDMIYHSKKHGHGWVDLEKAIQYSCDTYFYSLAHKLGIDRLYDIFTRFGLGRKTGIDLPGEASGLVPSKEWKKRVRKEDWYPGDSVNIGIGQGSLLATPLQMAQMAATIANRGHYYTPHLVLSRNNAHTPINIAPKNLQFTINLDHPEYWDTIIDAMQKVVHAPGGTAFRATQGIPYKLAGKTGTAQVFGMKQNEKYIVSKVKAHLRDHSWFIGFAPIHNPKIAIAVIVENKHSKTGADVARTVLDHFFKSNYAATALPDISKDTAKDISNKDISNHVNTVEGSDPLLLDEEE